MATKLPRAGAIDVGAACTSFLTGLALGAAQIESGRPERVLLVGADFITRITDYGDRRTAPLFADAAGSCADADAWIGPIVLGSDGSHCATNRRHARGAEDGRLRPGARMLLSAFGAGFTWGGGVVAWGAGDA